MLQAYEVGLCPDEIVGLTPSRLQACVRERWRGLLTLAWLIAYFTRMNELPSLIHVRGWPDEVSHEKVELLRQLYEEEKMKMQGG